MTQESFDTIEIIALVVGCIINLLTVIFVIKYTQKTFSIAETTRKTASQAAETADITKQSFQVSADILNEMRATREAQMSPYVYVYLDQLGDESAVKLFLVIKNAGRGIARNVKVEFEPELENGGTYSLAHIKQIINNIPPLPPGGEIRHAFALTTEYFTASPPLPREYSVHVSFDGEFATTGKSLDQIISLNFFQGSRLNRIEKTQNP